MRVGLIALALLFAGSAAADERPTIDLARIRSDIPVGAAWFDHAGSLFCIHDRTSEWTSRDASLIESGSLLKPVFQNAIKASNFRLTGASDDLFGDHTENTELQVGALIRSLQVKACEMNSETTTYVKGTSTVEVEWQIYSAAQGKVIARIPTHGAFTLKLTSADPEAKLVRGAFESSVQALLQSSEFLAATAPGKASLPSFAPPVGAIILPAGSSGQQRTMADAQRAVVSIFTSDGMGSGFLVSSDGYVLTNHHVAGDAGHVRLKWSDGTESIGEVVRGNNKRDVAVLRTKAPAGVLPLVIRSAPVTLGEGVFAIGTPREKEFAGTVTRGVISSTSRRLDDEAYIQSDVAITHGNSGGPLLDDKGEVIGISQSVYEPDGVSQNINFFVPIKEALIALDIEQAPALQKAVQQRNPAARR